MDNHFGNYLKRVREARGLSQSRLADMAGIDHSHVHRLEKGSREPGRDTCDRLADALNIDRATMREIAFGYRETSLTPEVQRLIDALNDPRMKSGVGRTTMLCLVSEIAQMAEHMARVNGAIGR